MPIRPTDDFSVFAGTEHMFFGLRDPFAFIREGAESGLREQVPDSELDAIKTFDVPKFLTLGRKIDDGRKMIVTHFGFAVRAKLDVRYAGGCKRELLDATLTFLFGHVDRPEPPTCRSYFDVHADAATRFSDEVFHERFVAFRRESGDRA